MLKDKIQQDLKEAMLAHDEAKVSTLRMLISEIRYAGNGRDQDISDEEVVKVVQKEVKKRRESIDSFKKGGREDLAAKEASEEQLLQTYLPPQMSDEELTKLVEEAITEVGAQSVTDMGKVMGVVMGKVGQGADSSRVAGLVRSKLV